MSGATIPRSFLASSACGSEYQEPYTSAPAEPTQTLQACSTPVGPIRHTEGRIIAIRKASLQHRGLVNGIPYKRIDPPPSALGRRPQSIRCEQI
jgi:hypothetical protein